MADPLFDEWINQWYDEHQNEPNREPTYEEYNQHYNAITGNGPAWNQPQGGGDGGSGAPPAPPVPLPPISNWNDWLTVYGSQPGEVAAMPDALKGMRQGSGAQARYSKFLDVGGNGMTQQQRDRLGQRFNSEFAKYAEESARAAQAGAPALGWHNWLTTKGPEGIQKDWATLTPAERTDNPYAWSERQRVQWR